VNVGNAGFSAEEADHINLAFNASGQPYVAYQDYGNYYGATVMMFDGTNWVNVGNVNFTAGGVSPPSLAFSPTDGEPYVGFDQNHGVTVMKFDGTSWVYVGNPDFSVWSDYFYVSLAFNSSGQPFVVYEDLQWLKPIVMKFDGINWVYVGPADGFSEGGSYYSSIAISPTDDQPYVVYADGGDSLKATIMKYDSISAGVNNIKESILFTYPNPTSKSLILDVTILPANLKYIEIEDLKGIRMFEIQTGESKIVLDVENYPAGIYIVKVKTEGSMWVGKFCKD